MRSLRPTISPARSSSPGHPLSPDALGRSILVALLLIFLAGGCAAEPEGVGAAGIRATGGPEKLLPKRVVAAMALSTSCAEAEAFLKEALTTDMERQLNEYRQWFATGGPIYEDMGMEPGAQASPGGAKGPSSYTRTNVQVEGVDEPDQVKTDGTYLYTLVGDDLLALRVWPPEETAELARVELPGSPFALHRRGDRVLVLSRATLYQGGDEPPATMPAGATSFSVAYEPATWTELTLLTVVDVATPEQPKVEARYALEGALLSSRRIQGQIYLVQVSNPVVEGLKWWPEIGPDATEEEIDAAFEALRVENAALISAADAKALLPRRFSPGPDGEVDPATSATEPLVGCDALYKPAVTVGTGLLNVVAFSLDQPSVPPSGASIVGGGQVVYASQNALYVAGTDWSSMPPWGASTDAAELADGPTAYVHKFALGLADASAVVYEASGAVNGQILSSYSLDEHQARLRVATLLGGPGWEGQEQTEAAVTVLEQQGRALVAVGHVAGLGEGERIQAVRFVGNRGYVVTFRQVDPLYVLDLSDPTAPSVAGELKIPGFSSYLHPVGDDYLLAAGRDATPEGQLLGLSFQLFDVSDPAHPVLLHKTIVGKGGSLSTDTQWDPHAFVYDSERGMLAVPIQGWLSDGSEYGGYLSELRLFRVDPESGIDPAGAISHSDLLGPEASGPCGWDDAAEAQVRRGVFIDHYIYSLSNVGLEVHESDKVGAGSLVALPFSTAEGGDTGGSPYPCVFEGAQP